MAVPQVPHALGGPLGSGGRASEQTPVAALWRTREYLRPYVGQLVVMLTAALVATGAEIAIPLLTKSAVDGPIAAAARPGQAHGDRVLLIIGIAAIALGIADAVLNLIRRWITASAVATLEQSIRDDLYAHLQRLEPSFHDAWQSGQLLSRATTDLSAIRRFAGFGIVFLIINVVSFAVIVTLLIRLNAVLGLLVAGVFAPVTLLCLRFERGYSKLSRRVQDQQDDLATNIEEAAAGIRVLKALGRRAQAGAAHQVLARRVYQTQVSKARLRGTFWASLDLVPNMAIALILLLGALAVSHNALTTGGLVAFIALVLQLVWPIEAMGYILALGQEAATAAQRVYEILDTPPAIAGPPGPATLAPGPARSARLSGPSGQHGGGLRAIRGSGAPPDRQSVPHGQHGVLVLDHVRFCYPGAPRPVLSDICLELSEGETVALVGATGSGKTTLLHLIARFADPTSGTIRLNGTDIRELPLPVLRSAVGCAFEDPTLFSLSVRENVTLGAPDATDAAVAAALAAAQADFVADLPWGDQTRIGEQGISLSGGQRQRIALARAVLANPSALLLDDPLSALDVHTEAKVTAALSQVLAGCTALVVAHRPSTVALANRVAVLDQGEIIAVGTHHELLESCSRYQYLMTVQGGLSDGPDARGLSAVPSA